MAMKQLHLFTSSLFCCNSGIELRENVQGSILEMDGKTEHEPITEMWGRASSQSISKAP